MFQINRRRVRHGSTLALIASTIAIIASTDSAGASVVFANSLTTGPHLTSSMNMFAGTAVPSAAVATDFAKQTDILVVGAYQQLGGYGAVMTAANPDIRIFIYVNGMYSSTSTLPSSWYMNDRNGNKIQSTGGQYLMDPTSTAPFTSNGTTYLGWTAWVGSRCTNAIRVAPSVFAGCWLDMLGTAPLGKSYNVNGAVPWNTATNSAYTTDSWIALTGSVGNAVHAITGLPTMGNGLSSGPAYYSGNGALLAHVQGGHAESWLRAATVPITWHPSVDQWKQNVQMLIDSAQQGEAVQVTVKTWSTSTVAQREAWRSYAYASYLLGNSGMEYFQFSSAHAVTPWNDGSPIYTMPIGTPTQTYGTVDGYLTNGVYERTFTGGVVLVNPGTSPRTLTLGSAYYDVNGQPVTTVTLPPTTGAVLTMTPRA
jgi:hypothetical protein